MLYSKNLVKSKLIKKTCVQEKHRTHLPFPLEAKSETKRFTPTSDVQSATILSNNSAGHVVSACHLSLLRYRESPTRGRIPRRRPANLTNIKCINISAHAGRFSELGQCKACITFISNTSRWILEISSSIMITIGLIWLRIYLYLAWIQILAESIRFNKFLRTYV